MLLLLCGPTAQQRAFHRVQRLPIITYNIYNATQPNTQQILTLSSRAALYVTNVSGTFFQIEPAYWVRAGYWRGYVPSKEHFLRACHVYTVWRDMA